MKTLKLALFAVISLAVFALAGSSASAYFYQPQSYPNYSYNPYRYGYQDMTSQITQANLHFVSNFVYAPPVPYYSYSYNYYSPYSYYGGYGYGY